MNKMMLIAVLMIPVLGLGAQAPPAASPLSPVTGNAINGKNLYFTHGCYGCHGFNGETGTRLIGKSSTNLASESNFTAFLRLRGDKAPLTPQTSMPNFPENALNDKQAKDIYAYIRSIKSGTPEAKSIPTFNTIVNAASRPYKP